MADTPAGSSDVTGGLSRPTAPELERLIGVKLPVLDDGFVRVVDYLGNDAAIVQAARVSYGVGTRKLHEDRGLIRYLLRHRHTTPFEMCEVKLHVRVPMDAWRQWIRHRTANVNEYSTRYSVAIDSAQSTDAGTWRLQSPSNRQGSSGFAATTVGERLTAEEREFHALARRVYQDRLDAGIAREQARKDLPLSTYTEAYWKIDLWNLLHFLELRLDEHAQHEIRQYAKAIAERIVASWVPIAWEAFNDYALSAVKLSALEAAILRHLLAGDAVGAEAMAASAGWIKRQSDGRLQPNRERVEFVEKAGRVFGLTLGWLE